MEIKQYEVESFAPFPRTLLGLNELQLLRAVHSFPQDYSTQTDILRNVFARDVEAEITNRNPDYAIMRVCPTGHQSRTSHWLIGYADDNGLFIHNLPEGNIDYCSEPIWYILQWINRIDEGFQRVQGDLLLRDIKEGWEIERLEREEKEDKNFFNPTNHRIGNRHELAGMIATVASENIESDAPAATAKTSKEKPIEITHPHHQRVRRESKQRKYKEVALQKRGRETPYGEGGD